MNVEYNKSRVVVCKFLNKQLKIRPSSLSPAPRSTVSHSMFSTMRAMGLGSVQFHPMASG